MTTQDRIQSELDHRERSNLIRPALDPLKAWLATEWTKAANKITSATSDDARREIAADMRANDRISHQLDELVRRGDEARTTLEKWSTMND